MKKHTKAGKRIEEIRTRLGLNQSDFAKLVGANSKGVVSTWERGIHLPVPGILDKVAKVGNTSIDWIITGSEMTTSSEIFNDDVKSTDREGAIKNLVPYLTSLKMRVFPIVSKISAGSMKEYYDEIDPEKVVVMPYKHNKCIVLEVDGDSMAETINDKDLVLIDLYKAVKDGDIAAVRLKSGEQFVKRYRRMNGTVIFYADNANYLPIAVKDTEIEAIGKAVWALKNLEKKLKEKI
ncbi:MAG: XRE family transcriptional regulator [Ignavibacteriaceae bacterium]|jgi:SOS-response transcriptional repressor LexA|nr:XRE family transcriptional regulator [Ignavibacteriaceae bacterium]